MAGDSVSVSPSGGSEVGQGPSLQVHNGMGTEGNGLQETGQKRSGETEATRFFRISSVEVGDGRSGSQWCSMHGVHRPRGKCSLVSFSGELGNLAKDIMPYRQRGQGMDPGRPAVSEMMLLVEHR